jgi:cyclophilin family peptidyl-prolyl cis-trans isomerase
MKSIALVLLLAATAPQSAASVRLAIDTPEKVFRPGRRMPVRFLIENAGAQEAKVDEPDTYLEGLEILDDEGKVVKATGKTKGITRRSVSLEAGGLIGRTVDIAAAFPPVAEDKEGWYRIRWSFGDVASNELRVYVMRDWIALLETNHGSIEMEFFPNLAPNHVQNFLKLSRSGFYEGSQFHRIIPGFMMQGGAPKDSSKELPKPLQAEFSPTKHVFGTVSMARTNDPNSATSQFFICFGGSNRHLDGNYTVFGQVISGEEVVKEIERVKTDHSPCKKCNRTYRTGGATACCGTHHEDRPEQDVVIKKVTISERKK